MTSRRSFFKALGGLLIVFPLTHIKGEGTIDFDEENMETNKKISIDDYIESNIDEWVNREVIPFLKIPSISTDDKNKENKQKIKESARYLANLMNQKGIVSEIIDGGNPVVYGEIGKDKNKKTLLVYGHLDVQPKNDDEKNKWKTDAFEPAVIGDRLYGRGSSDDKGQLLTVDQWRSGK